MCVVSVVVILFVMSLRPPISTRSDTLFPYTTPSDLSYIALFYIVDLEAQKINAKPLERAINRPRREFWLRQLLGWSGCIAVICGLYYEIHGLQAVFGAAALRLVGIGGSGVYLLTLWYRTNYPDLALDDPDNPAIPVQETSRVTCEDTKSGR